MLDGNDDFELIDARNEAFQIIRHAIAGVATADKRQVFIVRGGPGTGKSVIAVRLLAEVLKSRRLGFLVAPNKAFRDTLSEQLTKRHQRYRDDGKALFQPSWSFHQEERIRRAAKKYSAHVHDPFTLTVQFRCGGSDGHLNWLDDVLQLQPTGNYDNWADEQYELRVFDAAAALSRALEAKNATNKARLIAG
jgi:hypothetical protein